MLRPPAAWLIVISYKAQRIGLVSSIQAWCSLEFVPLVTEIGLELETGKELRKRALIVKFGQIGDVIMAIPAVYRLREQGFEIHWVCSKSVQPLLEGYSWIRPIAVEDKPILLGSFLRRGLNIVHLWKKIGFKSYDLCATLYYDRRYRLLTLPVRARRWIALSTKSRATTLVAGRHHTDEYVRVLMGKADGYAEESCAPVRPDHLPPSPIRTGEHPRRVVLVPGGVQHLIREQARGHTSEQALRRWPIDNYVALADRLLGRNWEVLLVGATEDRWVLPHFSGRPITDCLGKLSLPQVLSMFDECDSVITHDTGPLHLAGLSNVPLIGIFGPTDPATRVPRRSLAVGIWGGQGFACRPCYDGREFAPCQFNGCMHQVTPDLVLRELDQLLADRLSERPRPYRIVFPEGTAPPKGLALTQVTKIPSAPSLKIIR